MLWMLKVNVPSNGDGKKLQKKNPQLNLKSLLQVQYNPWPQIGGDGMI